MKYVLNRESSSSRSGDPALKNISVKSKLDPLFGEDDDSLLNALQLIFTLRQLNN